MKRKQLNVRIPDFHIRSLNRIARLHGLTQSEVVMMLIDREIGKIDSQDEKDAEIQAVPEQKE